MVLIVTVWQGWEKPALLWAIATGVEKCNSLTVTQENWVIPPEVKKVVYGTMQALTLLEKGRLHHSIIAESTTNSDTNAC